MSTPSINPMDPVKNPQGPLTQDPTKGPASAYYTGPGGTFVPQLIGQAPGRAPGDMQSDLNQKALANQQANLAIWINLAWAASLPDDVSGRAIRALIAAQAGLPHIIP